MKRAKHPTPLALLSLSYNINSKNEFTESGITYLMTLDHTRLLKQFFRLNDKATVLAWFKELERDIRKEVIREGIIERAPDDFFPDIYYED